MQLSIGATTPLTLGELLIALWEIGVVVMIVVGMFLGVRSLIRRSRWR